MAYDTAKDGDCLATTAKDGDCSATGANCPATGAEDCGCPVTASKEGGEYMDGDRWSFGAFWVLPTKDSCSTEIRGINSNDNCDELDGNGAINCNGDGNRGVDGDSNGNGD